MASAIALPGAVPVAAGQPDFGCVLHFGDPLAEQRMLALSKRGSVELASKRVLRLAGPDRLDFLNTLTSQLLLQLRPGESALTLNLNVQGFVLDEIHVIEDVDAAWLIVEEISASRLLDYLNKMRFRSQVEVADVSADYSVLWQPSVTESASYRAYVTPVEFGLGGCEIIVPVAEVAGLIGAAPAGIWAYEALRIAALTPRQDRETDHRTIPHEMGWITSAVHLSKGCYRGQETVSKVERMGKPPRRLTLLLLDGSKDHLPTHGTPVLLNGVEIGYVGAAAHHFELGPIATAVIKRSTDESETLMVDGQNASQQLVAV